MAEILVYLAFNFFAALEIPGVRFPKRLSYILTENKHLEILLNVWSNVWCKLARLSNTEFEFISEIISEFVLYKILEKCSWIPLFCLYFRMVQKRLQKKSKIFTEKYLFHKKAFSLWINNNSDNQKKNSSNFFF